IVFRFRPGFPDNVFFLKGVSIAAMIGVGLATFWYFARVREWPWHLSLATALATVLTPAFVFLATSTVMAECVFTLGQLVAVIVMARAIRGVEEPHWSVIVLAAVVATATLL